MVFKKYTVEQLVNLGYLEKPMDGNHGGKHPKSEDYVEKGMPFIMASDIINGSISYENCKFISQQTREKLDKGFARPGDVLLTHKATIGETAIVDDSHPEVVLTPQVTYYRTINGIDNRYLKYYFDSSFFQSTLKSWSESGSTRAYLGITNQLKLPVLLPDLETQKKIVRILFALDQKIKLNNQQNETIEKRALALVQKYINNEKGTVKLKEIMSFDNGFAFKSKDYVDSGKYKVITIKNVQDGLIDSSSAQFVTDYPKDMRDYHKLSVGDVLLSLTGNVGRVGIVFEKNLLLNQRVAKVKPEDENLLPFLYFIFRKKDFKQKLEALAKGTAQLNLSPIETLNEKIAYSEQSALKLSNRLKPFFGKIILNNQNNKTLSSIRDSLLPKLMSGEVNLDKVTI